MQLHHFLCRQRERLGLKTTDHHRLERERERGLASFPVFHTGVLEFFSNCVPLLLSASVCDPDVPVAAVPCHS